MPKAYPSRQRLLELPEHSPVQLVVFDIDGVPRGKLLTREKLLTALDSDFGFCNVVFGWDIADVTYDNTQLSGWHTGYPDAKAKIDEGTLRFVPWQNDQPLLIADFRDGALAAACPRSLLHRVLAKAKALDLSFRVGFEYEWFSFQETPASLAAKQGAPPQPITPGMHGYSLLRPAAQPDYFRDLWQQLAAFETPLEGLHTETGPGVYEAALINSTALEAADRAALMKLGIKQIATSHGIVASFMAKWRDDLPGCGGHVHQSLWSAVGKQALSFDESRPNGLSLKFEQYLAGILYALPRITPMWAPTVNSYKRLVPGSWAATAVSWGVDNRTAAVRVVGSGAKSRRLEMRVPGADANPYLVLAACVAAGLYGIEKELTLEQPPLTGNAYENSELEPLPRDLGEAIASMRKHQAFAKTLFGEGFTEHFLRTREWEWRQAQASVTDWERRRYLELV